eukprot:282473-Amorphochlora_amoeboformis.AAC.1
MWGSMFGQNSDNKAVFTNRAAIWVLGAEYNVRGPARDPHAVAKSMGPKKLRELLIKEFEKRNRFAGADIYSKVWLTYREEFPAIRGGQTGEWTTDAGWGCMLRTTQMMFCQGLIIHYLGRHWRLSNHKEQDPLYTMVLKWFLDYPVGVCPYSIHNLLKHAGVVDKKVFGVCMCVCLRFVCTNANTSGWAMVWTSSSKRGYE